MWQAVNMLKLPELHGNRSQKQLLLGTEIHFEGPVLRNSLFTKNQKTFSTYY